MTVRQDLHIKQGATWSFTWTKLDAGVAVDLTGYAARAAFKQSRTASPEAYLTAGADADGGTIALGGENGSVTLSMTADETSSLGAMDTVVDRLWGDCGMEPEDRVELVYDLELEGPDGTVTRELEGVVIVSRGVT